MVFSPSLNSQNLQQVAPAGAYSIVPRKNNPSRIIIIFRWFLLGIFSWLSFFNNINGAAISVIPTVTDALAIERITRRRTFFADGGVTATPSCSFLAALSDDDYEETSSTHSSSSFAMDPTSEEAKRIVREKLQLSLEQYQQLSKLAVLVNDWNTRINLISRKDCSRDVVFGRHILPSLAPLALLDEDNNKNEEELLVLTSGQRVCDVGTGGGFPGLPLAIARPDVEFLLIDSVGKKITAVQDIVEQLGLKNVKTYHSRAESVSAECAWVLGRSVSAIPKFAFCVLHLLQKQDGRLVYLIGGDIEDEVTEETIIDEEIENLLDVPGISDKRILVFPQLAVDRLAAISGEKLRVPRRGGEERDGTSTGSRLSSRRKGRQPRKKKHAARGQWEKRDSSASKHRGYEDFQRFDSLQK